MSEEFWPVNGSTEPSRVEQIWIEKILGQANIRIAGDIRDIRAGVVLAFDFAAEQAVPESERDGGEFVGNASIDLRIVAAVSRQGVRPEHVGDPFVVDDRFVFRDVDLASLLIQLLVVPSRVLLVQFRGDHIVVAEEQSLQCGQFDVFVAPAVAGDE